MTPKQKYDERKRLRLENDLRAEQRRKDKMDRDEDMENLVVCMGTSLARIADVLELWADQQGLTMADYEAAQETKP
jgi:hypothetical protein